MKILLRGNSYKIAKLFLTTSFCMFLYGNVQSPILVTSMPKCGTHLLTRAVSFLTGKEKVIFDYHEFYKSLTLPVLQKNQYFQHHVYYTDEVAAFLRANHFKILYIYRDPRDQVVSRAYWVKAMPEAHTQMPKHDKISDIITYLITDINAAYAPFMRWTQEPNVCSLKFEDLIGPKGKGNLKAQVLAFRKIAAYLGVTLTQPLLIDCVNKLFGDSATFRKGEIGSWKQHFTPAQKELFKKYGGDLLIELGYEKNKNW